MDTIPQDDPQSNTPPKTTFIYALIDPRIDKIRYVGKSNDPLHRLKIHIRDSARETTHKGRWIKSLILIGLKPLLSILEEVSLDMWQERERYWIEYHRSQGSPLTNEAPGGMGMKSHTPEIIAKIAASKKGKKYPKISEARKGKKLAPESIAKRSASVRAREKKRAPMSAKTKEKLRIVASGRSPSPETRAKISALHRGRVKSPEERKHISEAKTGTKRKPFTEEARQNMGVAVRRRSPELRARIAAKQKGKIIPQEQRDKISNTLRGRKRPPEVGAKVSAARKGKPLSTETRAKLSASLKGRK